MIAALDRGPHIPDIKDETRKCQRVQSIYNKKIRRINAHIHVSLLHEGAHFELRMSYVARHGSLNFYINLYRNSK